MVRSSNSKKKSSDRRITLLVVEDEKELALVINAALKSKGFEVLPAADGYAAIDAFRSRAKDIDLVLSDVAMMPLDGVELLTRLRDIDPQVKVVFMSGQSVEEALPTISKRDYSGWLQKPFSLTELVASINSAMEGGHGG